MVSEIVINQHYKDLNPVSFGHQCCCPRHYFGPKVYPHWLLHYIISGCGSFVYNGQTYKINTGEIFVIPPYERIYYEADAKNPWEYTWIGFTTEGEVPEFFRQPVIRCPGAGVPFDEMLRCKTMDNGRTAYLAACLWKLVSLLQEQGKTTTDYVDKALNYMHSGYASGITVREIAASLNLDRSYFYTIFTRRIGRSPQEYLIKLRLTKAAELMTVYGESPSTAAISVGYGDIFQFSKMFKKHFGMSPTAYVRANASEESRKKKDL